MAGVTTGAYMIVSLDGHMRMDSGGADQCHHAVSVMHNPQHAGHAACVWAAHACGATCAVGVASWSGPVSSLDKFW